MAAKAIKETKGLGIRVSDNEIISSQKEFEKDTGIFCEISLSSVYAAYKRLVAEHKISPEEKTLILITGNGLKNSMD